MDLQAVAQVPADRPVRWQHDASSAQVLLAVDPFGLGGVVLRSRAGPARDGWLAGLADLLPAAMRLRRMPVHISDDRLLGGLDLSSTLQTGRPCWQQGLLAEADGGLVVAAMAERLKTGTAACLGAVLDRGELVVERDGLATRVACRIGVVALDEGLDDDERPPALLRDRLAFHVTMEMPATRETASARAAAWTRAEVALARAGLDEVEADDTIIEVLCEAAWALGVESARAASLALRAARAAAALEGCRSIQARHVSLGARLVLAPRATRIPDGVDAASSEDMPGDADPTDTDDSMPNDVEMPTAEDRDEHANDDNRNELDHSTPPARDLSTVEPMQEMVLQAAVAAIPDRLLAKLLSDQRGQSKASSSGRVGAARSDGPRGRPAGTKQAQRLGGSARLSVIETLRAAAPWQRLRREEVTPTDGRPTRVQIRREDFRIHRLKHRSETTTLFVVDASGSAALHRLAEAKGAVELLLADCYVRRDSVAVIAFRGKGAEILLAPTRSLVRAKRSLAGLPGGGGTPLAAGIDAAAAMVCQIRGKGHTPVVVLLTDGRANIGLNGLPGRDQANTDAMAAAVKMRASGVASLLMDTSTRPQQTSRDLAQAMGAMYLPLPHANSAVMSAAVKCAGATAHHAG